MILRSRLAILRRGLLCSIHSRPVSLGDQGPVVSFCFDDFPRTACTVGGAILKNFGAHGTYYAALGLLNTSTDLGDQLRPYDIDSLLSDGHELGCHTFSHTSCRGVPRRSFERDVQKGRDAIRKMTGCDAANFAYPYGHVTVNLKKRIGLQMSSCRGIYGGINGPVADLNLLRANSLYGDVDRLAESESLLSENERRRGWLIFYTHDVSPNPSLFGCTPALLGRTISLAVEKSHRIASVKEVLAIAYGIARESPISDPKNYIAKA
jgi:peptidoglycan/xylan/chitin deacetylase (PgdA/CDA1 family)